MGFAVDPAPEGQELAGLVGVAGTEISRDVEHEGTGVSCLGHHLAHPEGVETVVTGHVTGTGRHWARAP